jgi:hypothetical protein
MLGIVFKREWKFKGDHMNKDINYNDVKCYKVLLKL